MCGDGSASTDSEPVCAPVRVGPSSSGAVIRAATASLPRGRPYVSLRGQTEFARVSRSGTRRRVGSVLVIAAPGRDGPPRVGVVAGRKAGGAVVRNRVKRRLREALAKAELRPGSSYVVVALEGVADATFEELVRWVRRGVRTVRDPIEEELE